MMCSAIRDDPDVAIARAASISWSSSRTGPAYCQPCLSPVWDTGPGRPCAAGSRRERRDSDPSREPATGWRGSRSSTSRVIGPISARMCVRAAGPSNMPTRITPTWTIPRSSHGAATAWHAESIAHAIDRARREWIVGHAERMAAGARSMPTTPITYLNHIPFADHGALLDPPTADVTARCLGMLAQLGYRTRPSRIARHRLSAARAGDRRLLVRPLGHQLHLRHLVGAGGAYAVGIDTKRR